MEAGPTFVRTKVRAAVVAVSVGGVIAVVEGVSESGEERCHSRTAETNADSGRACTQCGVVNGVGGQVGILCPIVVIRTFPHLLTKHGRERVLA